MTVNVILFIAVSFLIVISVSEDAYKTYNIESDKVCSYKYVSNRIYTGYAGIIVREASYFHTLSGKHSFTCRFEVEAGSKSNGLFGVIQNLYMRKDPETGECIDYIMLRKLEKDIINENFNLNFKWKKNSNPWIKFCGDIKAIRDGNMESPDTQGLAVTGFMSEHHVIEVEIFISKRPIINESIELEILFTPYLNCANGMWSDNRDCGKDIGKCIKKQNFKDGKVNCPFLNCLDEGGCTNNTTGADHSAPELQKLTLTAVTSIFCSFFLFLLLIWCCRYFELLCWGADTLLGRPNPVELSPMTRRAPSPTAPPPDTATKDLPPAYETLFPDR